MTTECTDLTMILMKLRTLYRDDWAKIENKTISGLQNIQGVLKMRLKSKFYFTKQDVNIIISTLQSLPSEIQSRFRYAWRGKTDPEKFLLTFLNNRSFQNLLKSLLEDDFQDIDEITPSIERVLQNTRGVGIVTLGTWLAIARPDLFMPLFAIGSEETLSNALITHSECLRELWGGVRYGGITLQKFIDTQSIIRESSKAAGVSNMLEASFYLQRFTPRVYPNYYVEEVLKELSDHVGKYLLITTSWDSYFTGEIPLPGDIVFHVVDETLVGYSIAEEVLKTIDLDHLENTEIPKILNGIGLNYDKYKDLFVHNFYKTVVIVKLKDFKRTIIENKDVSNKINLKLTFHTKPSLKAEGGIYFRRMYRKYGEEILVLLDKLDSSKRTKKEGSQHSTPLIFLQDYLQSRGYIYSPIIVSQFYTALKTKGFVILSGLTGTGKTKIAQELAELIDDSKENFLFLSVRPDWRDSKALLGYYNPLTGEYHKTKLLDFILEAKRDYEQNRENAKPYFVLLDEMNLAHVEYYFADFLSVLESGREEKGEYRGFTKEEILLHDNEEITRKQGVPKTLRLPPNLYIIGTVNMDETTYAFSPKVLDRAFVIEFHDVELGEYPPESSDSEEANGIKDSLRALILQDLVGPEGMFLARSKGEVNEAVREFKGEHLDYWNILVNLNRALKPYDMHFGYRVVDEIALFFKSAKESEEAGIVKFKNDNEIFDLALLMKILPKFHGNRKRLEKPLTKVLEACMGGEFEVKFKENNQEKSLKMPRDIEKISSGAIIEMLANWESYRENFRFRHTAKKALRMLRQLHEIGFASFS